jgi:hypothetical protein
MGYTRLSQHKPFVRAKETIIKSSTHIRPCTRSLSQQKSSLKKYSLIPTQEKQGKVSSLLESGLYEILHKDLTSQIDQKIWKLLTTHKPVLPAALKH